jgi:hypothetical protein
MLRPFCRATKLHEGETVTCHRMLRHNGPHISRRWRRELSQSHRGCWCKASDVRWYTAVEYDGPKAVGL